MFAVCSFGALISACTQSNSSSQNDSSTPDSIEAVPQKAVLKDSDVNSVYSNYIDLKNALVSAKSSEAQTASAKLSDALLKIKGCETTSELAGKISASSDLKSQRSDFTVLSADIIALMKNSEIESGTLYVQYCPMANSGNGGSWLASNSEIRNPYFGDEMMNCGEVKEEFKKK